MPPRLLKLCRLFKPPSMVFWLLLSAVFFLAGAAHSAMAGALLFAKVGLVGAIAAIAVIAAFTA